MRLLKIFLPLLALLLWSVPVSAQYNPTDPPEPGFNYMLTTRCTPAGSASQLTSSGSHGVGSSVSMKTSAATGFHFVQWEDEEGNVVSTIANFTYTMPSHDVTLIARYYYDPSDPSEPGTPEITHYSKVFLSTYPYGGGSINTSSGQSYEVGSTQTFRASANTNYQFINWTIDGEEVGTSSTISYTVTEKDVTLVANFQFNPGSPAEPGEPHFPRTLSLRSNLSGAASLNGGGTFLDGSRQRVYVSNINQYYSFVNWTDEEGNVVSEARDFYYTMPNRNVTLTANFTYEFNPDSPGEPGTPDPDTSIAENMVLYPRFGMYDDTHVMILCETEGSTIYYTTDGSDPTTESAVYTSPFFVGSNVLVKAFAVKEGMEDSPIRSFQVTVYKVSAPKFTFVNRKVEITSDTEGAIIRYTLDFSEPNAESEVYTTPLEPEENCRIKAYASLDGLADSPTTVFVYRRADYTIAAPTFSVNDAGQLVITPSVSGGTTHYTTDGSDPTADSPVYTVPITPDGNCVVKAYTSHINYFDSPIGEFTIDWLKVQRPVYTFTNPVISFSTETQGAQIRYTLDGSIPSEESTLYSGSLRLTEDCTVVARGFKENYEPSDTISFQYVYRNFMLPTPTASFANLRLTLSYSDEEAQILYTIDGSEPTASSTLYEAPLALTDDCTVKFIATRENFNDSETGVFEFTKADYQVMTPEIVYNQDNHMVTISCGTEGAEIRYTIDGTTPTATTGTVYTEPFTVVGNRTITAMGFRSDLFDSHPAAVFPITGNRVATPQASFANRQLTLTPEEEGDQIRYTTDGSEPTDSSTLYDSPLALTEDCTVRFFAAREHFDDSETGVFEFKKADYQVMTPEIVYNQDNHMVTISCGTEGAEIRYTVDGTTPTATTGTVYTEPFTVIGNRTITAMGFRSDLFDSHPAAVFPITGNRVATPQASFANRLLTLTPEEEGDQIRYTTDGSEPTASSTLYDSPLALTDDCTVKFIATRENFDDSETGVFEFTKADYQVMTPEIVYNRENHMVTISCGTEGAEIRYTIDGTTPTATTGTVYTEPFTVVGNRTITAMGFRSDLFDSHPAAVYPITGNRVATPQASFANRQLTLTPEEEGDQIRYTTDGSEPTDSSTLYDSPLALTEDCTVKFFAARENFDNSETGVFEFTKADYQVMTPEIVYNRDNHMVTISCGTEGAEIRYTIDGTTPTATTGTVYTEPFTVVGNRTITAMGFRSDLFDSHPAAVYPITGNRVATPQASFANRQLTLTPEEEGDQIRYTTDGSEPTASSTLYDSPLALTDDCTVKFIATRENFDDSETGVFEFRKADYQVMTPEIEYNRENHMVTISCGTEGAEIRYTIDGTTPTATTGTVYTEPFTVAGNRTITAMGFRSDLFDSHPAAVYPITGNRVATPQASFANRQLTLTPEEEGDQIRYTTDGSEPTASSTLYDSPLALTEDCTVKFFASREHFDDSETGVFEFTKADYQVMTPEIVYNRENHMVTISCGTEGAEIRYTIDGTTPTATTGTVYTEPFTVAGNRTITAMGFRSDLFDSHPAAVYPITGNRVATPQASFANRLLTLTPEEEGDQIRYTTDGSEPTDSSTLYDSPLALTEDCTVKFFAAREHFDDSEPGEYVFVKADHQRNKPTITPYFHDRKVTVSSRENATIVVTIDGETEEHDNSCDFDVNPTMKNISAIVIGDNNDICYDSEPEFLDLVFHLTPEISYDGHEIIVSVNPNDPSKQNAERIITYNDETVTNETILTDSFGSVTARVESDNAFRSEVASLEIDFFNTGTTAGARKGHRLAEAFSWNNEDDFTELTIVGDINREDFDFLASLSKLTTLSLRPDSMAEESYANALNMPLLTTVEWGRDSEMPADIFGTSTNPNLLLWVDDESLAPATVRNVVTTDGTAESITLDAGFPFNPHMPVAAKHIEFRKKFNQPTEIDVCRGWETIILPFTPESIRHEEKGEIVPYERWNEEYDRGDYGDEGPKPFWIYEATPDDWIAARDIEAYVPYIISMPNNPEYIHAYNLAGQIIFAADDAILGDYDNNPGPWQAEWIDGLIFEGSFMPFEGEYRSLNNEWEEADGEILPGSYFLPDGVTLPFEACLRGGNPSQKLPLFPGGSGISLPTLDFQSGISVEAIGQGAIRLTSTRNCTADIYTTTGMRMRSVKLNAGESVTVDDLAPGIYLVARHKIMIK